MTETTIFLTNCLNRLKNGDLQARDELVATMSKRLTKLADVLLRHNPRVARWEEADDIVQKASMRLHRCLTDIVPMSVEEIFRIGALQLRRELVDIAKHYYGPEGPGSVQSIARHSGFQSAAQQDFYDPSDSSLNPQKLAIWTEFHESVEKLPATEKQVFDLIWYHELSHADVAQILMVSERQIRRHWQSARLKLQSLMGDPDRLWRRQ